MELQQLRYFVALARELHFQRAAARVHVSQPTLSQQLRKLEKELGAPLLERSPHQVRLTASGEKFLPHALAVLDALEKGTQVLRQNSGEPAGILKISAIPTMGPYLLPQLIRRARRQAPRLTLELYEETTSLLLQSLKDGKRDLGILSTPVEESGIVTRTLGEEPFWLALPKSHHLAEKRKIRMKELSRERMLILQEGHCFGNQALDYCKRSREDSQVVFQGSSLLSVMKLADSGEGVTLVPKMAVRASEFPGLRFIPFTDPQPHRDIAAAWRVTAPLSAAHHFVMDAIEEILKTEK